jgi:hypothetical protein
MVFIVGHTEQASQKANLLQQIGQVFLGLLKKLKRIFCQFSFLRNKNKILVERNLMKSMIQVKRVTKLKQL